MWQSVILQKFGPLLLLLSPQAHHCPMLRDNTVSARGACPIGAARTSRLPKRSTMKRNAFRNAFRNGPEHLGASSELSSAGRLLS